MRILIFNWRDLSHPQGGGAELHIQEQAKIWVKLGHVITLFCGGYSGCKKQEVVDGVKIIRKGGKFTVYLHAFLYYIFNRKNHDFVIDDINGVPFFTPLFVRKPRISIIHHLVKDIFYKELKFPMAQIGYFIEDKIIPIIYKNTRIVTVSNSSKKELIDAGLKEENIHVIYNGLDLDKYKLGNKKTEYESLIYLGRIRKYKRLNLLIEQMSELLKNFPNLKLHIVGQGDMLDDLKLMVKNLDVEKNIVFHGFVSEEEKISLLQKSWLFVTPSEKEGWGLSVLEANACGTPAIAYDVPGLNESIKNGFNGYLVKSKNDSNEKIRLMLNNAEIRNQLSKNAFEWSKKFNWEDSAKQTLGILSNA